MRTEWWESISWGNVLYSLSVWLLFSCRRFFVTEMIGNKVPCLNLRLSHHSLITFSLLWLLSDLECWFVSFTGVWCLSVLEWWFFVVCDWCPHSVNPPSVLGHIFTSFGCDWTIFLALGRVYGGQQQKINGYSLYYFGPHMSFWSCIKSIDNKQNKYENPSQYWSG